MASSKDIRDFVLEQLNDLGNITCKPMMGEFMLYYNGVIFGGIYDDRLLVKKTETNKKYDMQEVIPYPNAKPMLLVDIEDPEEINEIVKAIANDLRK